jgi:UDP-N-acetylmuramoylalanine--D-glutamate ligase
MRGEKSAGAGGWGPTRDLEGKRVSILGLGASGEAAAHLVLNKGGQVYVSDLRTEASAAAGAADLRALGAQVDLGGHDLERISSSDLVVVSPGIPPDAPVLRALRGVGRSWISEPELAFRFFRSPLIAVTGTNGKTTTAVLTAHLLRSAGMEVGLGGNIGGGLGPPASALATTEPVPDWLVVEVSSFQLADIRRFRPDIGILTNLAPDHLDRYPGLSAYYADKANLFRNATEDSKWVLNGDQPEVAELAGDAVGDRFWVSLDEARAPGAWLSDEGDLAQDLGDGVEPILTGSDFPLLGRHNVANGLFAAVAAQLAGAGLEPVRRGLGSAPSIAHRMEPVGERDGVLWINDSKATNVAAAASALGSLDRDVVVLLGGKDKGEDLEPLARAMEGRVRLAVLYGAARDRFARDLNTRVPLRIVPGTFEDAVAAAADESRPGEVLLLSPACSSFDMFADYAARGERFRTLAEGRG